MGPPRPYRCRPHQHRGRAAEPARALKAQESLNADPATATKGSFTLEQVSTIVQGLQPQQTQDPGDASQSPARLEAVNAAVALLGDLVDSTTGHLQAALLMGTISTPEVTPPQSVTSAPITALTTTAGIVATQTLPSTPVVTPPQKCGRAAPRL